MPTPILMPQMGESVAEGTIVRWMKKVGDPVDRDEPLFEISTDKVDAEIPSPASGVLTEIAVNEGETVPVNSVVGTIGQAGEAVAAPAAGAAPAREAAGPGAGTAAASTQAQGDGQPAKREAPQPRGRKAAPPPEPAAAVGTHEESEDESQLGEDVRRRTSPLVRRIAREHRVDVSRVPGTGSGGRVTKDDILRYIADAGTDAEPGAGQARPAGGGARVEIRPLSVMRRKIAEHMVLSRRTSAHVHSVFHVSFATVERLRQAKKAEYERRGTKLTYMAFIARAVTAALRRHPMINASLDGHNIVLKKDINLGIAVALDEGLIVPVVKQADEKSLLGLGRAIADLAERARAKQLRPEDVQGGTFTITNPGQFGSQFGMPIINQPQVAILGVGTVEKRPVVIGDAIGIRPMAYLTLGYDHRLVDGATGDRFMADVKQQIEEFDESEV
jgi:2-oxoglutarate dehydrogenase E2 component (dihydrolipoamide succinyltransferase)